MRALTLRDDLFLLAHDDMGKLFVTRASIGVGLAGATLIDLLLDRRIGVVDGRLDVIDPSATGDDDIDATIGAIAANTAPCGPRAWVSWISHGAYSRAAQTLSEADIVQPATARRLGVMPVSRYQVKNSENLVRVRAKVRYAIAGTQQPDPATSALCGLIRVLRLESSLLLSMPTADVLVALERMTHAGDLTVRQVIHAVETVIAAAAYR